VHIFWIFAGKADALKFMDHFFLNHNRGFRFFLNFAHNSVPISTVPDQKNISPAIINAAVIADICITLNRKLPNKNIESQHIADSAISEIPRYFFHAAIILID